MRDILLIAVAGAMGALSRYGLSGVAQRVAGNGFPLGTLLVNVLGSAFIGFIMQVGINSDIIPPSLRVMITVGFLGAFTTFSTFSYETVRFLEDGAWLSGTINIIANVGLSILAAALGIVLGRIALGGVG